MDAVSVIKDNINVETILDHYKVNYKYYGNYIRCACPIHGGDNPTAFVINEDFLWSCHTGDCGAGDVFKFVEQIEDVSFPIAVKKVAEILGIDIDNLIIAERKTDYQKELSKFLKYIQSKKKKIEITEFNIDEDYQQVRKFRNFKESTLRHFDLRYYKSLEVEKKAGGTFNIEERLGIPIHVGGIMVGMSLRRVRAKDNIKWYHIPHTIVTGDMLYNIDACKNDDIIIVVEGMFDVWRWYEAGFNATCTFGAHLTDMQYKILLKTGKDIAWCYDGDQAGIDATKRATEMLKYKVNQWLIKMPQGLDPGQCSIEELKEYYNNKERIL